MPHPLRPVGADRVETVIVGAGPAALAVALQLAHRLPGHAAPDRLAVLDPTGRWLAAWQHQLAAQRIRHLRSPAVHHPHPSPFALVHACDQQRDLRAAGGVHLPTVAAFDRFCAEQIRRHALHLAVRPGLVTAVRPRAAGVDVHADIGRLRADRVVLAGSPRRPRWPDWACLPALRRTGRVSHGGGLLRRERDGRPAHAGQRIAVVGGGLSAAHLARGAVEDGAEVVLLTRRPIVVRRMDVDPRWLGPTLMGPFAAAGPVRRRTLLEQARGGGTMPAWAEQDLRSLAATGRLQLREGAQIRQAIPVADQVALQTDGRTEVVDQVWLATGATADVDADPTMADLRRRCPVPVHDGLPELRADLGWADTVVHVVGALAGLQVGPVAGNLAGHRDAARRVVDAWM